MACDCQKTRDELAQLRRELNLVPRRLIAAQKLTTTSGSTSRVAVKLPPRPDPDALAFAVLLKCRDTLSAGSDTCLHFLLEADAARSLTDANAILAAGAGLYLTPGQSFEHSVPRGAREIVVYARGFLKSDFATNAAVVGLLHVYEMVAATKAEGCR